LTFADEDYDYGDRITPRIAKQRLDAGERLFLLDVREPIEFHLASLPETTQIPIGELQQRFAQEIDGRRDDEIIVICHHGIRSRMVADWLRQQGCKTVKNLDGGIDRWARDADPSIPRY
jgi:adenylyltransferase/sulfurtransferase